MNSNKLIKSQKSRRVKFLLAPRPQKDPLAADFEAPQNVLIPQGNHDVSKLSDTLGLDPQVFESETETKKGMLERAHEPDGLLFDTDILKAMSSEFDFADPNNVIDDDFVDQAGGLIEEETGDFEEFDLADLGDHFDEGETTVYNMNEYRKVKDYDDMKGIEKGADSEDEDDFEDAKTVFTNYSMTSSVMRRSEGLKNIDEHFERLFEKEYADDTEIGALDLNDDIQGTEHLKDYEQIRVMKREVKVARKRDHDNDYTPEIVSEHHKDAIVGDSEVDEDPEDDEDEEMKKHENRLDCESILTYNSNLYNHPKLIVEPRRRFNSKNTDVDRMDIDDCDIRSRSEVSESIASTRASIVSKLSNRPPNETADERRARKKALKEYRRDRRQERKQNEKIFKTERAKLVKQKQNNKSAFRLG